MARNIPWTDAEDAIIRAGHAADESWVAVVRRLPGRTLEATRQRAQRLGMTRKVKTYVRLTPELVQAIRAAYERGEGPAQIARLGPPGWSAHGARNACTRLGLGPRKFLLRGKHSSVIVAALGEAPAPTTTRDIRLQSATPLAIRTITNTVSSLIAAGYVEIVGRIPAEGDGGSPRRLLQLSPKGRAYYEGWLAEEGGFANRHVKKSRARPAPRPEGERYEAEANALASPELGQSKTPGPKPQG